MEHERESGALVLHVSRGAKFGRLMAARVWQLMPAGAATSIDKSGRDEFVMQLVVARSGRRLAGADHLFDSSAEDVGWRRRRRRRRDSAGQGSSSRGSPSGHFARELLCVSTLKWLIRVSIRAMKVSAAFPRTKARDARANYH